MIKKNSAVVAQEKAIAEQVAELHRIKRPNEIIDALKAGYIPQGTRLVDPNNPEVGVVFAFSPAEAASLVPALQALAQAQLKK